MPALIERWSGRRPAPTQQLVSGRALGLGDYLKLVTQFSFNGSAYSVGPVREPGRDFEHLVRQVHEESNVVAAAVATRGLLLKQIRFAWRNNVRDSDRYRQLFGTDALGILEQPDPGTLTLPQWLATMEYHVSYGGSAFTLVTPDRRLELLAPDLVDVVIDGPPRFDDLTARRGSARKIGYAFWAEGRDNPDGVVPLQADEVIHWAPEPHPCQWWTGSSWVGSVLQEVVTDKAAARYLQEHLGNAAMPAMVVKPHEMLSPEQIDEFAEKFSKRYGGVGNAGRTMWLGAGSELQIVGSKIGELDLRNLTGGGETRVAMRARIPAAILGIRESLAGSSLNAGNYNSARRQLADSWFAPTAADLCASVSQVIAAPAGAELWYDAGDALFLQEDALDSANILQAQAAAIRQLVDGGFDPSSAVAAVRDGNLTALNHTGLTSVQLIPPGETGSTDTDE